MRWIFVVDFRWIFLLIFICNLHGFRPEKIRQKSAAKIRRMIYSARRRNPPQSAAEIRRGKIRHGKIGRPFARIRRGKIRRTHPPHNHNPLCKPIATRFSGLPAGSKCRSDKHAGKHLDDSLSPCWLMVEPKWQRQTFIQQHV